MSERSDMLLSDVQPELADDPIVQMAMVAIGNELDRVEAAAETVRASLFPATSVDPILSLYEQQFGLPVNPAGVTLDQRRQLVEAHIRKRVAGSGSDWEAALTAAMGNTSYTYFEGPGPNQVTIKYGFAPGVPTSQSVIDYVREITPSHIQLLASYSQGFLIGISNVGDPL